MATTEQTINDALAAILIETRSLWRYKGVVKSENVDVLKVAGKKPDILIVEPNVSPVIVETEVMPAPSVEADAKQRLGEHLTLSGLRILSSLAIRLPARLRDYSGQQLRVQIATASDFEVALYTGKEPKGCERWPRSGWIRADVADISTLIQSASVPPSVVEEAANKLVEGVSAAAALLADMSLAHSGAMKKICEELRQQEGEQTRRMATTILANALVFHESLSRGERDLYEVRTLEELRGKHGGVNKGEVLEDWERILKVNYWPIFDIAKRILRVIPADTAHPLLDRLVSTAGELVASHMMRSHDLTGAVFQRLIADRKFLAAYYTHPASAALLARLAIDSDRTPGNGSWASVTDVTSLRIADLACGTGTLLSAAYRRVSQLHELARGDAEVIHPEMMSTALIGCDVLPAAAHLTASMLAGAHPTVTYKGSSILALAFGPRPGGGYALGSLDLLDLRRPLEIVAVTAKALEGTGETEHEVWNIINHWSVDLIVMNPPFTRDTKGQAGGRANTPNPMFAAFGLTTEQQRAMAHESERLLRGTVAHGNAGEASAFMALADRKLKDGGTLAMVMPLSMMSGEAWQASRRLLRKSYSELVLVTIAGGGQHDMSFSADTGMGECLVIGRKTAGGSRRATFVVLNDRPSSTMVGSSIGDQIRGLEKRSLRRLEDGPVGGSLLHFGNDLIGYAMEASLSEEGPWNLSRVSDGVLAQVAFQLASNGVVWLPGTDRSVAVQVPVSTISKTGKIGPYDLDITGNTANGGIRGPFRKEKLKLESAPTYPILWSHEGPRERFLQFEADYEGFIREVISPEEDAAVRAKAARIWGTASHCHFNRNFQFNSQSTAMQYTDRKTIGGRAWTSISLATANQEKALVIWSNSTFGLLLHWWHANKEQAGRGNIGVSALESLPVLDVAKLSEEQLNNAVDIFDHLKHKELRPVNEITMDSVRAEVDERLATEVLGFPPELLTPDGPLALLRQKLALEPSITGGKVR